MKNRIVMGIGILFLIFVTSTFADPVAHVEKGNQATTVHGKKDQNKPAKETKKYEPAEKFIPTEKLRADDVVKFPVDI